MTIPCRVIHDVNPGLWSLGAGYNKSPSAYRDSTFLSISAVPSNAVFWITYYWLNQIYHTNDKLETKKLQKMNSLRKQCTKLTEILESSPQ